MNPFAWISQIKHLSLKKKNLVSFDYFFAESLKKNLQNSGFLNFIYFIFPQTMLTAISMSAIATNGVVPGNEEFYLEWQIVK